MRKMQATNVFAGKHGFLTPRDLFKWAGRGAVGYQQLAEAGYMLVAERLREPAEREVVAQVLQAAMRVQVRGSWSLCDNTPQMRHLSCFASLSG